MAGIGCQGVRTVGHGVDTRGQQVEVDIARGNAGTVLEVPGQAAQPRGGTADQEVDPDLADTLQEDIADLVVPVGDRKVLDGLDVQGCLDIGRVDLEDHLVDLQEGR